MCVGMTDAGSEGARHAFKAVPRLQTAAFCVLPVDIFAVFCPQVLFPIAFGIL